MNVTGFPAASFSMATVMSCLCRSISTRQQPGEHDSHADGPRSINAMTASSASDSYAASYLTDSIRASFGLNTSFNDHNALTNCSPVTGTGVLDFQSGPMTSEKKVSASFIVDPSIVHTAILHTAITLHRGKTNICLELPRMDQFQ